MKKILLSVALVAMSVFSMSALSFKVEVNGVEIKEGDEIELTELEAGTLPGDQCIIAHMKLTNLTSNPINASVLGLLRLRAGLDRRGPDSGQQHQERGSARYRR